jgi:DNA polymerase III epsilon subunit-like protein
VEPLVNPRRPLAATRVHGITEQDVADASGVPATSGENHRALADARSTVDLLGHYLAHAPDEVRNLSPQPAQHGVRRLRS